MAKMDKQHEAMKTEILESDSKPNVIPDEPTAPWQKLGVDGAVEEVESIEPKRKKLAKGKGVKKNKPVAQVGPSLAPDHSVKHDTKKLK